MTLSASPALSANERQPFSHWYAAALLLSIAAVMAVVYWAGRSGSWPGDATVLLAIIPITLAAYSSRGLVTVAIVILFVTGALVPAVLASWGTAAFGGALLGLVGYVLILSIFGYLAYSLAAYVWARRLLTGTVQEQEALLARATDLDEVERFVMLQAMALTLAREAALIARSPLDGQWEVVDDQGATPLADADKQSLAYWLLDQETAVLVTDLSDDPRFQVNLDHEPDEALGLLVYPLADDEGDPLGVLALLSGQARVFSLADLERLQPLMAASQQALMHAEHHALTSQALDRRLHQLSTLQRAARELNTRQDPRDVMSTALARAAEITGADAGLAAVVVPGLAPAHSTWNARATAGLIRHFIELAGDLPGVVLDPGNGDTLSQLQPEAQSRLLAPIRREGLTLGVLALENRRPDAFGPEAQRTVAGLADHVAVALENLRLFDQVVREKTRSEQILTNIADALLTVREDGRILAFNPAAEALTGWRSEEATGHLICDVLVCSQGNKCQEQCRLLAALRSPQVVQDDHWVIQQRRGGKRVVTLSAAPLPASDGGSGDLVVLLHDITERDELERFQRDLIAAFSHELRTPLTSITSIADMLAGGHVQDPGQQAEQLTLLQAESMRLAEFAGRMLDVARLEGGRMVLEMRPVPLGYVVREMMTQWRATMLSRPLSVDGSPASLWVWADENAIQTVLNTLVDNAHKYSLAGTPVKLSLSPGPDGYATVTVQDQGPGVPVESQERIFDRFYRLEGGSTQSVYGQGLGLYLARSLVEAMGGMIWVESEPGSGSQFRFALPIVREGTLEDLDY